MIEGNLVIDAVVHGFNFRPDNCRQPWVAQVTHALYHWIFDQLHPRVGELGIVGFHLFTFNDLTGTRAWYEERTGRA